MKESNSASAAGDSFALTEALFLRLLGFIYLSAFASFWPQIVGLVGSRGVAPASRLMSAMHAQFGARAFFYAPSLFWLNTSDTALILFCVFGCLTSVLLMLGIFSRLATGLCFVLYLSLSSAGQPFTAFQWDALLLEAGFLALFAGAPWLVWAYRLLLFRLMFESSWVKIASHDPNWRNLHALRFHFMTQPLPNPIAYYVYRLPGGLLDAFTAATLFIEFVAPVLLFCPRRFRQAGVALLVLLQVAILLTGNYAFFNLLALGLCLWGLDDRVFARLAPMVRWKFPRGGLRLKLSILRNIGNGAVAVLILLGAMQLLDALGVGAPAHC